MQRRLQDRERMRVRERNRDKDGERNRDRYRDGETVLFFVLYLGFSSLILLGFLG